MRETSRIIVHCSASPWGDADEIDRWHRERGWMRIGYHHVVLNGYRDSKDKYRVDDDGLVEDGRSEEDMGAHVRGHNADSLGVCLIGLRLFSWRQLEAARTLIMDMMLRHEITIPHVLGHYELDPMKTCPTIEMDSFRGYILGGR